MRYYKDILLSNKEPNTRLLWIRPVEGGKVQLQIFYNGKWTSLSGASGGTVPSDVEAYVDNAISNLVNGAPVALDTLKEIADVLEQQGIDLNQLVESLSAKQDVIADLSTIRSGAALGATAVQTETDPVFSASPAAGIQSSDITNWNSKTSNIGTVTKVTVNNTEKSPDASGVVDIGTVITSHQDISGKADKSYVDDAVAGVTTGLTGGSIVPAMAGDLESWAGSTQNTEYVQDSIVDTTGGSISINSNVPATLVSLAAKTDFKATSLVATGFNLLRHAVAVGAGGYFPVPALRFGVINTANEPNGVLFTDSEGNNLRPTVYFKPLSSGVPTSVTDGTACAYTDATTNDKSYRFYTTSQAGYLIVSDITRAATCAHIGWSKRYDEYIGIDAASDAGSTVDVAAGIHALHDYDWMLHVGSVSDRIEKTGVNQITWYRMVDRVTPTWTNTAIESEGVATGEYLHEFTISAMKSGGAAAFMTNAQTLNVTDTTVSYTDSNATGISDYIKYELNTPATGTAAISSSFAVEDWGLIYFLGAEGEAYITLSYAQNIQDSVRAMLTNIDNKTVPIISEAIARLYNEIERLKDIVLSASYKTMDAEEYTCMKQPMVITGSDAPTVTPKFVGQVYIDTTGSKIYMAKAVTNSTANWVILN